MLIRRLPEFPESGFADGMFCIHTGEDRYNAANTFGLRAASVGCQGRAG